MKVFIKHLSVEMEIKNTGVEMAIYSSDNSKHMGDFFVTRSNMIWCKGRKKRANGTSVTWEEFAEFAEKLEMQRKKGLRKQRGPAAKQAD